MKVWILFVYMTSPVPYSSSYMDKASCELAASSYKRAVCIEVTVPKL